MIYMAELGAKHRSTRNDATSDESSSVCFYLALVSTELHALPFGAKARKCSSGSDAGEMAR